MEQLLELQKLLLERLAEGDLDTRAVSSWSCNSHSCNGKVMQDADEMLERMMSSKEE